MSTGTSTSPKKATLADLARVTDKAELIAGRIVTLMPTGRKPNRVASRFFRSLDDYVENTGCGEAYTGNMAFTVPELSSGRESFAPDASFFLGPFPADEMKFLEGPPVFAVEVRSENDYDESAQAKMAAKRADYFEAGTLVVWDVDPLGKCIHSYRREDPDHPVTFHVGQMANAEPAVSGWQVEVDWVFSARRS
jgi:Uma2 family endonuclease